MAMAGSSYETRKDNLIAEANCIETALSRSNIFLDSLNCDVMGIKQCCPEE